MSTTTLTEMPLKDLQGRLQEVRKQGHEIFEAGGENLNLSAEQVDEVRKLNDEAADLQAAIDEKVGLGDIKAGFDALGEIGNPMRHPTSGRDEKRAEEAAQVVSLGQLFVDSPAFEGRAKQQGEVGESHDFDVDVKATVFQTSAGWAAPSVRGPVVVDYAVRALVVADLLPTINVSLPTYLYMEETTFTNAAAETSEGSAKPESALALTERTEFIRKIATYLPVTDEQLEDVDGAREYIDNRLGYMVGQRLDGQILNGNGTAPNIAGITDDSRTGLQTQAKGSDPTPDAIYKAMTEIRVDAFSEPNASVWHPRDWQDVRLLRTADGIYIWGNPADAGPERIWGLRVVQTAAQTEGTALVGDFNQSALLLRQGITMKAGYVNDDLIKNRLTIVAEIRAGVAVFRPAAFCTVTGI